MARSRFGGTDDDRVEAVWGFGGRKVPTLASGITLLAYDAPEDGNQISDLTLDEAGTQPLARLASDADGYIPAFYGPDGVTSMWVQAVDSARRFLMLSTDLAAAANAVAAAEAERALAEQARDDAAAQAARLEAVEATNDGIMSAVLDDPEAAFTTKVKATYATKAAGISIDEWPGIVADEQTAVCSISNGSANLVRSSGEWTPEDVGKVLSVPGAQATPDPNGRTNLPTTIAAYVDPTTVTLNVAATATATDVIVTYATDCSAALQAFLDEHVGRTLIVPRTEGDVPFYAKHVRVHSDTILRGPGVIKCPPTNWDVSDSGGIVVIAENGAYSVDNRPKNVTVESLRVDGNKGNHYGDIANRTRGEGINVKYGDNANVLHNTIWDVDGDGIDLDYAINSRIIGNRITNASGCGIHHSDGNRDNTISFNFAQLCGWDQKTASGVNLFGFDISPDSKRITFIGNTADGCYGNFMLGSGGGLYPPEEYQIIANGNRSLAAAATPAAPNHFQGVMAPIEGAGADMPTGITALQFFMPADTFTSGTGGTVTLRTGINSASEFNYYLMPRSGRIVGVAAQIFNVVSAGSITLAARLNNVSTNRAPVVLAPDATGDADLRGYTDLGYTGGAAFVAGDQLKAVAVATADYAPTNKGIQVTVFVTFDAA